MPASTSPSIFSSQATDSASPDLFARLLQHMDANELDAAATLIDEASFDDFGTGNSLPARAVALQLALLRNEYVEAMTHADEALELAEDEPLIYHLMGRALWATSHVRTGAEALVRAAELFQEYEAAGRPTHLPVDPLSVYFLAGEACQYYEQYEAALGFYEQARRHAPANDQLAQATAQAQDALEQGK